MKQLRIFIIPIVVIIGLSTTLVNNDKLFEITKNIEIFVNVYKKLNAEYVDEVDPSELMRTGIDAMVHSLDPYTLYWSESQIESHRLNDETKYQGLGAETKVIGDYITITEIYEEGSAYDVGLKVGDKIIKVNGTDTKGLSQDEFDVMAIGAPGTVMQLDVKKVNGKLENVSLERGKNPKNNIVPYSGLVDDHIGYVKLTQFKEKASAKIKKAMEEMKDDARLDGIILDLRYNGGGLLREAISISNLFIPKDEVVVSTRSKVEEQNKVYKTQAVPYDTDIPVVVLINGRSASASEIVSGVIQDYDRGVILGQRSYGKGLVQNTGDVGYNAKMKLTISKYYIPSRRCIQAVEYDNGEPVDIPDDKRSKFKTRNGRTVLDGGGVSPDVKTEPEQRSEYTEMLMDDDIIFEFVNEYTKDVEEIAPPQEYAFTDIDAFKNYITKSKYDYQSHVEQSLQNLLDDKEGSEDEKKKVEILLKEMNQKQDNLLDTHKEEIIRQIELEIISRYHYQSGKAAYQLDGDPEITEAISILKDKARYNKILKK